MCVTAINNGSKKGNSLGVEIVETSYNYNMNMRWSVLSIICFKVEMCNESIPQNSVLSIICFQHWNVQWIYTTEFIILIWFLILLLQLRLRLRDGNCGCWERLQMWTKLQGLQLIMEEVTDMLHILYIENKCCVMLRSLQLNNYNSVECVMWLLSMLFFVVVLPVYQSCIVFLIYY